ncbi:hypothetical protein BD410DRAFT_733325 [Rickenella mellea]|uniref:Protein kinase domain-containing protein n=1 Tax=Rickenella mellea TaxID=50990 RepID=A0A4Y7PIR9_9AGAM|nr:hypothetical protein BD410DRAFT_733325 [Rickenella mellea]
MTTLGENVPFFILEYKRILGEGGCDPSVLAGCSMRRAWIQVDMTIMRDRCCCPTLMIAGGGPWICVLGAVFTDKVIVQRLTEMMWIGLSSTSEDTRIHRFARVMMALRQNLPKLRDYYGKISATNIPTFKEGFPHPRFYPYPTSFVEHGKLTHFDYLKMLEDDPTCVTYLAKIRREEDKSSDINKLIVVKFVDRYGYDVHQFLATKYHSPQLRYYGPLEVDDSLGNNTSPAPPTTASPGNLLNSPMNMVIMDYVKPHRRPADAHAQLEAILTDLHIEGYVFCDLREPNILFDKDGKVQLIDLNWAGSKLAEFVKYPLNLSSNISWAHGVAALMPIRPQHDWDMLRKLQWHSM